MIYDSRPVRIFALTAPASHNGLMAKEIHKMYVMYAENVSAAAELSVVDSAAREIWILSCVQATVSRLWPINSPKNLENHHQTLSTSISQLPLLPSRASSAQSHKSQPIIAVFNSLVTSRYLPAVIFGAAMKRTVAALPLSPLAYPFPFFRDSKELLYVVRQL